MNLSRLVSYNADVRPFHPALKFLGESMSYLELWHCIERATAALVRLGVARGDRIAYLGYNHPQQLVLLFALARLGALLVPLNWRLALPEHRFILGHSEASFLFVDPAFFDHVEPLGREGKPTLVAVSRGPQMPLIGCVDWTALCEQATTQPRLPETGTDAPVLLVYTSGTTGTPKGTVLTQANLVWNAINSVQFHELSSEDRVLAFLPMFHVGGLNIQVLPGLYAGASVTLLPRFDVEQVLKAIGFARPQFMLTVPTTLRLLVTHPKWQETDLSSLKLIVTGSMNTPDSLIQACHARGVPVGQVYGCTETAPLAICRGRDDALAHVGAAGKPAPHVDVRLVAREGRDAAERHRRAGRDQDLRVERRQHRRDVAAQQHLAAVGQQ